MDGLYIWIRSVACYFLFMSVLEQLLPSRSYVKYIRLFGGMILILLVFHPLVGGLHIENKIARYYEEFSFQEQANDLKQEILGVETKQLSEIIRQYEAAVAQDIKEMAEENGMMVQSCEVKICREQESQAFGQVQKIALRVSESTAEQEIRRNDAEWKNQKEERGTEAQQKMEMETVEAIEKIVVAPSEEAQEAVGSSVIAQQFLEKIRDLQRNLASYYDLEERYVEIRVMERKR